MIVTWITASPRRIDTGAEVTVRLAGGGQDTPFYREGAHYRAGVVARPKFTAKLDFGPDGWTGGTVPQTASLDFKPAEAALLTTLAGYYWPDASITVESGPEGGAPTTALTGTVASVEAAIDGLKIEVADLSQALNVPACTGRFGGVGGADGEVEAAGRVKRRSWGRVWNVEGLVLDKANNVYEFGDPARPLQEITTLRDMGRAADPAPTVLDWQGSIDATLTALAAAECVDGSGVVAPSIECAKWWTQPAGPLTADLKGEIGDDYVETAPEIAASLLAAADGPAVSNVEDAAVLRDGPAGLHIGDANETWSAALDRLLGGVSMAWVLTPAGAVELRPWTFDDPVETIQAIGVTRKQVLPPMGTRRVGYQKAERIHNAGEIAAVLLVDDVDGLDDRLTDLEDAAAAAIDDGTLTRAEKIETLIPLAGALEGSYNALIARAITQSVDYSAATAKRTAWLAFLTAIDPDWDDTTHDSPVDRAAYRTAEGDYRDALNALSSSLTGAAAVTGGATIGIRINQNSFGGANPGEAYIHGFDAAGNAADVDGYIVWQGQRIAIPRQQGNGGTVLTAVPNQRGYILFDTLQRKQAVINVGNNQDVIFAWKDADGWHYDKNSASPEDFTPDGAWAVIGEMQTGSADSITTANVWTYGQPVTTIGVGAQADDLEGLDVAAAAQLEGLIDAAEADADDGILTGREKLETTIRLADAFASRYTALTAKADALKITYADLTSKRATWLALLAGMDPAYTDTDHDTAITRSAYVGAMNDYEDALNALAANIAAVDPRSIKIMPDKTSFLFYGDGTIQPGQADLHLSLQGSGLPAVDNSTGARRWIIQSADGAIVNPAYINDDSGGGSSNPLYLPYSDQLDQWTVDAGTPTVARSATVLPIGALTMWDVTDDSTSVGEQIRVVCSGFTTAINPGCSFFVMKRTGGTTRLRVYCPLGGVLFDSSTGIATAYVGATDIQVEDYGDRWRVGFRITNDGATTSFSMYFMAAYGAAPSGAFDATKTATETVGGFMVHNSGNTMVPYAPSGATANQLSMRSPKTRITGANFDAARGATKGVIVSVYACVPPANGVPGSVVYDSLAIGANLEGGNAQGLPLVYNGDFALGSAYWLLGAAWSLVTDAAHSLSSGGNVLKFSSVSSSNAVASNGRNASASDRNTMPVSPGDVVVVAGMIDASGGTSGFMRASLYWRDKTGAVLSAINGNAITAGTTGWQQSRAVGVAPANAAYATTQFNSGSGAAGTYYCGMMTGGILPKSIDDTPDGATYARLLASELSSGAHKIGVAGSGLMVGDLRQIPALNIASASSKYTGAVTYSAAAGSPATATISVAAGTLLMGGSGADRSYSAMSVGVSGTGGSTVTYFLYADDASWSGGSKTLHATTDGSDLFASAGRVYFGQVDVVFPTSGSGSGGGARGGGGGVPQCVAADSVMPDGRLAREIAAGDVLRVLDYATMDGPTEAVVTGVEIAMAECVQIESASGIRLVVSTSTPVTLRDGRIISVLDVLGEELPVEDRDGWRWERIEALGHVWPRLVAHIHAGGATYAAGARPGRFIYTHNPAKP
jgi:hypothetical protein